MRIFLDTAPLIYIIEGHKDFTEKVIELISDSMIQGHSFVT